MNVLYVSHADLPASSAMHIVSIAGALEAHGVNSAICTPKDYSATVRDGVTFPNGEDPDLIHAWTPREGVRKVTEALATRYGCPYIVHLEDNEEVVASDEQRGLDYASFAELPTPLLDEMVSEWRSHPRRSRQFIAGARAVTVLIDRLLEFVPAGLPAIVFWPGFDEGFRSCAPDRPGLRRQLGLSEEDRILVYTGNIHAANEAEVTSLIQAAGILHERGVPVKLLKTGSNFAARDVLADAVQAGFLVELGFISRADVPVLLQLADVLVQPGQADAFNDYRFPSKLPEFLVSGKPVILPRSNIGRYLRDREECILLERGDAQDIAEKVEECLADPELSARIGQGGRNFALKNLDWAKNVLAIQDLYTRVLRDRTAAPAVHKEAPHAVKLIAFHPPQPLDESQAALALRYGLYGFCFTYPWPGAPHPKFPFCIRVTAGADPTELFPLFQHEHYIHVNGAPLLLVEAEIPWRETHLHLALVQPDCPFDPRPLGFDAAVEVPPATGEYLEVAITCIRQPIPPYVRYRGVTMRSTNSPGLYARWLAAMVEQTLSLRPEQEPLVFIDAWQPWHAATREGLYSGIVNYYQNGGFPVPSYYHAEDTPESPS